ncbi:4-hydroxybutyrate CoA-transferase [Butyricicoccus faecihominis]|uniref:acetyl-CoA hydrolase/transferase family protein n=1 Tax=Butyricicoccus faecihominis TaxID=1712515 RepID=UPI00247ABABB|nr:acetyl-CoA hydrolase/transferase C-terminal domain-containing protein [Butyricicoccus faecihominis]MCQ5128441.1 4-hydroxybutyrate CoA-transferase [Butyricicoccus faecihominis]
MQDWKEIYRAKLTTAAEAVKHIPDGARVFFGHAANEPPVLVDAMVQNYEQYKNVEIVHWVPMGKGEYTLPKMAGHIRHNALFVGPSTRAAVQEGRADYTPFFFYQSPRFFTDGTMPVDVALVSLTPPDKHGFCSFGVSVGGTKPAALAAKIVIAQINDQMPRTMGDSFIHVSRLTYAVEASSPLPELGGGSIGAVEEAIGRNCAALIEDGSTLQLGIGSIPDAVLKFLGDKKDLGIHSEMFSDGVVDLYRKGVITGAAKTLNKGKMVAAFLMGSKKLYEFVDQNPDVLMLPVDYVNDPVVIAQQNKMVAINSCLQVDFNGQVNSESMGAKQFSGIGGQLDYVRGASMCPNGKAILAMPSTAKHGTVSRIVPVFAPGTTVTTTRTDVHYIVTEYGAVDLRGKSLRERARLLISIAHPDFRDELRQAYRERYGNEEAGT